MDLRLSRRRTGAERGASAVLVALSLTSLMAVSAFAVDVSQAYAERRHDQNTVDAAVMSGLVEGTLTGGSINDIVAEVRDKVDTTLGRTLSNSEWLACQDPEQLTYTTKELQTGNPTISPVTDCISFSVAFDELRVRLPEQEVIGVFGPAVGFGNLTVDAAANGKAVNGTGRGGPPFVALSTATTGDFVCLRTSSAKEPMPLANGNGPGVPTSYPLRLDPTARPDPCHSTEFSTASENFGTLKPWAYRKGCTRVGNTEVEVAVSIGIDHIMGVFTDLKADGTTGYVEGVSTVRLDGANACTVAYPNTFEIDEGLNAGGLSCALVSNTDSPCNGETPRFQQGPYLQNTYKIVNSSHDNKSPWFFMRDAADLYQGIRADECENSPGECTSDPAPNACVGVAASRVEDSFDLGSADISEYKINAGDGNWSYYDRFDAFVSCLQSWATAYDQWQTALATDPATAGEGPPELFTEELGNSARFGFIPQVAEDSLDKVTYVHVEGFRPIFMQRIYIQETGKLCDPSDPRDSGGLKVHDAGQQWHCGASNKTIDRLASLIFACGMVPDTLCNKDTGYPASRGLDIYEFRLSK